MLIGDYCPRALEPIYDMLEAIGDLTTDTEALDDVMTKDVAAEQHYEGIAAHDIVREPVTELPCNVFGTVDRCDGQECEHDGNCFSGCCSVLASGEQKKCMPLYGDNLCPIAIDPVE